MSNISIKVNLKQLNHVEREIKGKDGKMIKCLVIPIEENKLFTGEKGVYLDITAIEIKDRSKFSAEQKDTHLLKQNFDKVVYDAMSEEQRSAMPILGNAVQWGSREPLPRNSDELSEANPSGEDFDPLPF